MSIYEPFLPDRSLSDLHRDTGHNSDLDDRADLSAWDHSALRSRGDVQRADHARYDAKTANWWMLPVERML